MYVRRVCFGFMRRGVSPLVGLLCLVCGGVGLEYDLVSLGLHCFLRLAQALYCRSGRCLAGVAFSM